MMRWLQWFRRPLFSAEALRVIDELTPDQMLVVSCPHHLTLAERKLIDHELGRFGKGMRVLFGGPDFAFEVGSAEQRIPSHQANESKQCKHCSNDDALCDVAAVRAQPVEGEFECPP